LQQKFSPSHTLESSKYKLAYYPVPKTASSSMKHAFYRLEHGAVYKGDEGIHDGYFGMREFYHVDRVRYTDYARIAVIRDPARRIMSAFQNRVVALDELAEGRIDVDLAAALGVVPSPSRQQFLCNLEAYRLLSPSIRHHTEPFTTFLGHDLGYFTDVVKIDQLEDLAAQISVLTGRDFVIGHQNRTSSKEVRFGFGPKARRSLLAYCAGDYALMKGYYRVPPALLK
jgi:hypothetical protein